MLVKDWQIWLLMPVTMMIEVRLELSSFCNRSLEYFGFSTIQTVFEHPKKDIISLAMSERVGKINVLKRTVQYNTRISLSDTRQHRWSRLTKPFEDINFTGKKI